MKIAIIGYGKMGHMIEEIALERGHEVVCIIDAKAYSILQEFKDSYPTGMIISNIFTPENGFESEEFRSADVAIEFTTPGTAKENVLRAWAQGVPVVCGSTGWKPEELKGEAGKVKGEKGSEQDEWKWKDDGTRIEAYDETGKRMLVWSSNFSVGVNITFELNKFLAEQMVSQPQYSPSIKETHHIHKLDKPSGTAKTLAEQIIAMNHVQREIPIESIREGEVPGTHEVIWDSEEDTIVITHIAKGRRGFALGAVLAAEGMK